MVIWLKPVSDGDTSYDDDDDDEDEDDDDNFLPPSTINEMKEMFEPLADLGIPGSVTAEEFNKKGELETVIYLDKDELVLRCRTLERVLRLIISVRQSRRFLRLQQNSNCHRRWSLRFCQEN